MNKKRSNGLDEGTADRQSSAENDDDVSAALSQAEAILGVDEAGHDQREHENQEEEPFALNEEKEEQQATNSGDGDTSISSVLKVMALHITREEQKQPKTSLPNIDLLHSTSLHKKPNHQEPTGLAAPELRQSGEISSQTDLGRHISSVSASSAVSNVSVEDQPPLTPLEVDELGGSSSNAEHSSTSANERRSTAANTNLRSSGMDDSMTQSHRMDDSINRFHRSHRTRDEFEAKRQALPTSTSTSARVIAASPSHGAPPTIEVEAIPPIVQSPTQSSTNEHGKTLRRPQQAPSTYHTPAKTVLATTTAPALLQSTDATPVPTPPPINTYRVALPAPPSLEVARPARSSEQLVEATLVRDDSSSFRTDAHEGEDAENPDGSEITREAAPMPPDELQADLIVQAHRVKVYEAAGDLLRSRRGIGLICLLIVVVMGVALGVASAVISGNKKDKDDSQVLDLSDLETTMPSRRPKTSAPTLSPTVAATSSPTMASPTSTLEPTTAYQGYVVNLFPNYTLPSLTDPESPQSRALRWLVDDHQPAHLANLTDARLLQRFALATLYFSTTGIGWRWARYWLSKADPTSITECDWWSYYDLPGSDVPSICNAMGLLERLSLNENILRGTLPKELALLTHLTEISMIAGGLFVSEENKKDKVLTGSIPVEWMVALTNLEKLDLSRNAITGSIPTEIGLLTNLRSLKLLENNLDSQLPTQLFQLTSLTEMWLYGNSLRGNMPTEVGLLTNAFNFSTFAAFTNQFNGTVPTELGLLTQLTILKFNSNQLRGTIPLELTNLSNLRFLGFGRNRLTGTIHTEFGKLNLVREFLVGGNRLTGTIPTELGNMLSIKDAGMSNNDLTGTIPTELGQWEMANRVVLDGTSLTGTVPRELCQLADNGFIWLGVFVDCDEVQCGCRCCWCDCLKNNETDTVYP